MARHLVGSVDDFPEGVITTHEVGGRTIGVVRVDDKFRAMLNVCPHQLAPICLGKVTGTMLPSGPDDLVYGLEKKVIRCPRHGWEFDLTTGEAVFGISKLRLKTFPVHVEAGKVLVEIR